MVLKMEKYVNACLRRLSGDGWRDSLLNSKRVYLQRDFVSSRARGLRMRSLPLFLASITSAALLSPLALLRQQENATAAEVSASPEMNRLAKALAGDWNTEEQMERSSFFPNGGSRHGHTHVRLGAGGTTLIDEVHSDGSAGKLDGFLVIWWEKDAKLYRFFTCFNDADAPCKVRGTAHWEGDIFVNDYEETVDGRKAKCRDSFIQMTPTSHSLVAAIDNGDGTMKTLITTRSTRR
jgi:hypothetical protein